MNDIRYLTDDLTFVVTRHNSCTSQVATHCVVVKYTAAVYFAVTVCYAIQIILISTSLPMGTLLLCQCLLDTMEVLM